MVELVSGNDLLIKRKAAYREVSIFLTRLWEHPLLDYRTVSFRYDALSDMFDFMRSLNIPIDNYATLLVGGQVWSVNHSSDSDMAVIMDGEYLSSYWPLLMSVHTATKIGHSPIQICNLKESQTIFEEDSWAMLHLFTTPDNYAVGNTPKLRLQAIDYLSGIDTDKYWDQPGSYVRNWFDFHYKTWGIDRDITKGKWDIPKEKSRKKRFNDRLEQRSKQSKKPELYKSKFLEALNKFSIPNFATFKEAVLYNGGHLHLDYRYKARGITTHQTVD